jgi:hypothetical protein
LCCISCCVVQKEKKEKRGWVWVAGESTPEPRRTKEKKRKKPTARYLIDQYGEKGKAKKKKV